MQSLHSDECHEFGLRGLATTTGRGRIGTRDLASAVGCEFLGTRHFATARA